MVIATLGSHSALDICRGAKDEGFHTLVIAQKGREQTYANYYKTVDNLGCVDECLVLDKFSDILSLTRSDTIFIPHRSFEAYLDFDYDAIENKFKLPIFGNKYLLKIEERGTSPNQYDLLKEAGIRYPLQYKNPAEIDRLCLVKVQEAGRKFERAFFLVDNEKDYHATVDQKITQGIFTPAQLDQAVIEEFIVGVQVNLNFFYSPINKRLELLGTDTRRQTNLEGLSKIPASNQTEVLQKLSLQYEEAGHIAVTVLESMLERAFELGERFVKASAKLYPPGIIGPFALQSIIIPGPPKKDFVVVDVSPRMPGSPGIAATPYSSYLYGEPRSAGRRVAMEIRSALVSGALSSITT